MNKIILHGKIGKDPEVSYSKKGTAICKFPIATDNGKDKDPTWHNIVSFNKTAELIAEHFHKGKEILVEGKQEHNKYEKDGKTTYYSSVALFSFDFCGNKDSTNSYTDKEPDYGGGDDSGEVPF